ncbi:transcriptional regulator [uncultured Methanobrevibacter sp.]|jgi:predicted transcriptional regulator|uniref:transcriptional regulator n=1 Tax=uncultured Methanobrevibacter sp. TaxID=253161 RepID=UPI0025CD0C97|nr:transcriptional regulator [uncultured Methanobrevibacter sp.]MDO5810503.1 transcriptional regulator [Methanobrevibacter sp.]
MKPPCEIVVWYVIPAIRSELAKELLNLGMKQKDVSELMDITQPAVSQYITDKRGSGIKLDENVRKMIHEFARQLSEGEATKADLISRTCTICKHVKTTDVLAQLNINKEDLGEDCQSCLGSEAE